MDEEVMTEKQDDEGKEEKKIAKAIDAIRTKTTKMKKKKRKSTMETATAMTRSDEDDVTREEATIDQLGETTTTRRVRQRPLEVV